MALSAVARFTSSVPSWVMMRSRAPTAGLSVGSGQGVAHGLVGLGEPCVRSGRRPDVLGRSWVVFHGGEGLIGGAGHSVVAGVGSCERLRLRCSRRKARPGRSSAVARFAHQRRRGIGAFLPPLECLPSHLRARWWSS